VFRQLSASDEQARNLLRGIVDRLEALERGGAIAGRISLGTAVLIGDVEVTVADTGGGHRTVTFRSPAGIDHVIVL